MEKKTCFMKKRDFNSFLKRTTTNNLLDPEKIAKEPKNVLNDVIRHIVRNRGPVLKCMINDETDMDWLRCCAYFYETVSKKTGLLFVHTSEHVIK